MSITTKNGDEGKTTLLTGEQVAKSSVQITTIAAIDELSAYIGLLNDTTNSTYSIYLLQIRNTLSKITTYISQDKYSHIGNSLRAISKQCENLERTLPPFTEFLLLEGNFKISLCNVVRAKTRVVETKVEGLSHYKYVDKFVLAYFNRLSDYFFLLARKITKDSNMKDLVYNETI